MLAQTDAGEACDVCGAQAVPGALFCWSCGAALRAPSSCPACGTDVPEGASFCPGCGLRMVGMRPEGLSPGEANVAKGAIDIAASGPSASVSAESPPSPADDEVKAEAREAVASASQKAQRAYGASNLFGNALLFVALLVGLLVVIRVSSKYAPDETSPFEGGPPPMATGQEPANSGGEAAAAGAPIHGTLELAPDLKASPAATLFIIARIQGTPERGPPIAVKKIDRPRFPLRFSLGAQDVMRPDIPFEGPFDLRARLDRDGNAMTRAPGDLYTGTPVPAQVGAEGLVLTLDSRLE